MRTILMLQNQEFANKTNPFRGGNEKSILY